MLGFFLAEFAKDEIGTVDLLRCLRADTDTDAAICLADGFCDTFDTVRPCAAAPAAQTDLAEVLGMSSKQAMSNKVRMNRWSADDLIKAAELCGGKVAIIMPDGQTIQLRNDEDEKSPDE